MWIGTARKIGLRVVRTPDAYAASDGNGTLAIAVDAALDADDSLGQMIFHELCHSLVEGEESFARPDWGMDNTGPDHDWREHACLRVQWVLTGRHGLRTLFAPTTDFRAFWDQLSGNVLADRTDRSVQAAILALRRAELPPWGPHLGVALAATARIAQEAAKLAIEPDVLWRDVTAPPASHPTGLPAGLWRDVTAPPASHPTGLPAGLWRDVTAPPASHPTSLPAGASTLASPGGTANSAPRASAGAAESASAVEGAAESASAVEGAAESASAVEGAAESASAVAGAAESASAVEGGAAPATANTCGSCAWRFEQRGVARCRHTNAKLDDAWPACERYEATLDCQTCGACCRAAYHSVEVHKRDPMIKKQPSFVVDRGTYLEIRRDGDRCAALAGGELVDDKTTRFHCVIYDDRPRTCRDFTLGSTHCLTARRRVGLTL